MLLKLTSLKKIHAFGKEYGVRTAVENDPVYTLGSKDVGEHVLMAGYEQCENLLKNYPDLGILLDLGHLKVSANRLGFDRYKFIRLLENNVLAIHIHENNARVDSHEPLKKNSWCLKVTKDFKKVPAVLESTNLTINKLLYNKDLLERSI